MGDHVFAAVRPRATRTARTPPECGGIRSSARRRTSGVQVTGWNHGGSEQPSGVHTLWDPGVMGAAPRFSERGGAEDIGAPCGVERP